MPADQSSEADTLPKPTPDDRLREVSAIFAAGIARLKARAACAEASSDEPTLVIEKVLEDRR